MTLSENGYEVAGFPLLELAQTFGAPLFVYDAQRIENQYRRMVDSMKVPNLKVNYACKALTSQAILKLMHKLGAGLDTVSIQEIELGIKAGFSPNDIIFTPNSVSFDEIEKALEIGVKINIDNIETLEYLGHKHDNHPYCIRINPHIMAGGNNNISVGHIDSKFGISIHQMPLVERIVKTLGINIEGVHMHTGSDILDVNVFLIASEILFEQAKKFPNLQYIDLGSGFKVKYKEEDYETDMEELGEKISAKFNAFCEEVGKKLTLMFEPGKYLVSQAGYFLAKTNVVKQTTSTVFVGVDSGFNHLIRPMFYNAHHDIVNVSNPHGNPKIYTVVGYICETDTFGWNRKMNEVRREDILCFKNAGAYCYSMASQYNSRLRPAEVLLYEGKALLIRRRETLDDLLGTQIEVEI
jgi:diaminopimelate decarboxylase